MYWATVAAVALMFVVYPGTSLVLVVLGREALVHVPMGEQVAMMSFALSVAGIRHLDKALRQNVNTEKGSTDGFNIK